MSEEKTAVLSTANITGSPTTTILAAILGASQYLATNGAHWPTTRDEWLQFVAGLVIAILGAMTRLPTTQAAKAAILWAIYAGVVFGALGCASVTPSQVTSVAEIGAAVAGRQACEYLIPDEQRANTATAVRTLLAASEGAVYEDAVNSCGVLARFAPALYGLAWEGIHAALDAASVPESTQWNQAAQRLTVEFLTGCREALG